MTITTTLNRIRDKKPCADGWQNLLAGLGKTRADDEPLTFSRILEINGIDDAIWCMRAEPQYAKEWRLFAIWCARQTEHLLTDKTARDALNVAERHAYGLATNEELADALNAARGTTWGSASDAARAATRGPTWAATWAAARAAALNAAKGAATDAAWSAARAAASDDATAATWHVARAAQTVKFLEITGDK